MSLEMLKEHETVRTAPVSEAEALVDVRGLSLWYGKKQALYDISVRFPGTRSRPSSAPRGVGKAPSCAPSTA